MNYNKQKSELQSVAECIHRATEYRIHNRAVDYVSALNGREWHFIIDGQPFVMTVKKDG